jgi:hypothetical protein
MAQTVNPGAELAIDDKSGAELVVDDKSEG